MGSRGDGDLPDGMEIPVKKSKDKSKGCVDKVSGDNVRGHNLSDDLLRGGGSKPEHSHSSRKSGSKPTQSTSKRASLLIKQAETQTSASQKSQQPTLSEFEQTAPTVASIAALGKRQGSNLAPDPQVSKRKPPSMNEYLNMDFSRANGTTRGLIAAAESSTGPDNLAGKAYSPSPSPPRRARSSTPLRDEAESPDRRGVDSRGFSSQQPGFFGALPDMNRAQLYPGIPQGSTQSPSDFLSFGQFQLPHHQNIGQMPHHHNFGQMPHHQSLGQMHHQQSLGHPGYSFAPDFAPVMNIFKDGMSKVLAKMNDFNVVKTKEKDGGASPDAPVTKDDSEDESSEDEQFVGWAGQPLVAKNPGITVSEEGVEAWRALKGLDDSGLASGAFKKVSRKEKDINFYIQANRGFKPKERNLELPSFSGYKEMNEKRLVAKDRVLGAIGGALVAAVDTLRECAEDLASAKTDFENDQFENCQKEAAEVCATAAQTINNRVVNHVIKAFKMAAVESALITLERRAITESEVGQEDMRKILGESPPDDVFLYGGAVKDSVQKARDASLLSRAFTKEKPKGNRPWVRKAAYRPKDQRFKPRKFLKQKVKDDKEDGPKTYGRYKKEKFFKDQKSKF